MTLETAIARTAPFLTVLVFAASAAAQMTTIFSETFNSGNVQGWQLEGEWQIGPAQASAGQNFGQPDPAVDADGTMQGGVAGIVIGGNATTALHGPQFLTSPPMNTAGAAGVTLELRRWLNADYPPFMQSWISVWNGMTWTTIWAVQMAGVYENSWSLQTYDITAFAAADMRIRFGQSVGLAGSYNVSSWNIDNVLVEACTTPTSLRNPSFDNPLFPTIYYQTIGVGGGANLFYLPDWTVIGGDVDLVSLNSWQCAHGPYSVDMNGTMPGAIEQTVVVDPDCEYSLDFAMARNPDASVGVLEVQFAFGAGTNLPSVSGYVTHSVAGVSLTNMQWQETSAIFATFGGVPTCGPKLPLTIRLISNNTFGPGYAGPVIDNVRLRKINGSGQANSAVASLKINGVGPLNVAGPWAEGIVSGGAVVFEFRSAVTYAPFLLLASPTTAYHTPLAGLGTLDIGTPPGFFDIAVIWDGFQSPGALFFVTGPAGVWTAAIPMNGIPPGFAVNLQGLVYSPTAAASFTLTAAHTLYVF